MLFRAKFLTKKGYGLDISGETKDDTNPQYRSMPPNDRTNVAQEAMSNQHDLDNKAKLNNTPETPQRMMKTKRD